MLCTGSGGLAISILTIGKGAAGLGMISLPHNIGRDESDEMEMLGGEDNGLGRCISEES